MYDFYKISNHPIEVLKVGACTLVETEICLQYGCPGEGSPNRLMAIFGPGYFQNQSGSRIQGQVNGSSSDNGLYVSVKRPDLPVNCSCYRLPLPGTFLKTPGKVRGRFSKALATFWPR